MTFSYTDEAIVSTSPTGRHLSTVIKRPCVLKSGWTEHAEEICKVLNDLQPAAKISGPSMADLIEQGYLATPRKFYGDPLGMDFGPLEQRVTRGRRGELIATLTAQLVSVEAELARAHEQLRKPVELNSERLAALASMKPAPACTWWAGLAGPSSVFSWLRRLFAAPLPTFTERDLQRVQAAKDKRKRRQEKRRNGN
jgi:hypothetical protein